VGAVLTQNTNWENVARAIANLKRAGVLDFAQLCAISPGALAELIRPCGYYNVKAKRLKALLAAMEERGGLDLFFQEETGPLRERLLAVNGIGKETADSILLYAAERPVFVVDAYTHRILNRHGLVPEECGYDELQEFFMDSLPRDPALFNEYHALLVRAGKEFCRKSSPRCQGCPLEDLG